MKNIVNYFFALCIVMLCGCSALEPRVPDNDEKISLQYSPRRYRRGKLYDGKIVFTRFRDLRPLPFYDGEDDYFKVKPEYGLAKALYSELKADNIFKRVGFADIAPPERIDQKFLDEIQKKYHAQFIFVGDIAYLNMERLKKGTNRLDSATINLRIIINAQIIHTPTGMVIWMEKLSGETVVPAITGRLSDAKLRSTVRKLQKEIGFDMRKMIKATSMRIN